MEEIELTDKKLGADGAAPKSAIIHTLFSGCGSTCITRSAKAKHASTDSQECLDGDIQPAHVTHATHQYPVK